MADYAVNVRVADGFGYISFYYNGLECCYSTNGSYDRTGGFTSNGSLRLAPETGYILDRVEWYSTHGPGTWLTINASEMTYTGGQYRYTVTSDMYESALEDELWFDAYFIEDDSGGGGSSGGSGSGGSENNWDWCYWDEVDGPASGTTDLDEWGINQIYLIPASGAGMKVECYLYSSDDIVAVEDEGEGADHTLTDSSVPEIEGYASGDVLNTTDDTGSGTETLTATLSPGESWAIAYWEFNGNATTVDWEIVRTDTWGDPDEIITLSGVTSYSATTTDLATSEAGYVAYTTPAYKGKLICQTTSGKTTPNFYSHLASSLITTPGDGRLRSEAIDTSSYILDSDDNGRGIGRDTKIEWICSANTKYYWYVNAAYAYRGDNYSIPWSLNYYREYTLTYVSDGTTFSTQKFYENDVNITLISSTPTKAGYNFVGWQLSTGTYKAGALAPSPGANATATAVWKKEELIIQYDANGGTGAPAAQTFTKTPITISATEPTRDGYQFKGWSTNSAATSPMYEANKSYSLALSGETINLYAVWQLKTYTVSYNLNGGTSNKEFSSHNFTINNRSFTVSSYQPERTGYNFSGWSDRGADSTIITHSTNTTYTLSLKDYILYAVWTPKTYTISYNSNGGSGTIAAQTKTYGTNLILASSGFTNGNLRLSHWNTVADGSGNTYSLGASYGDAGTSNVTLYAIWADDSYSLIYDANGGVGGPGIDAKLPSQYWKINITTAPTRTNYTFKGWAETSTAKTPLYKTKTYPTTTIQVTNANKILYAVWWPHFSWSDKTQISANLLVDYIKTYLNKTISKVTTSTSLLYLTSWYNEAATALGIATLPDNTIIQETHLQNLANAFNSY